MVRGTFSPSGRWRPAVVARLARTLGFTKSTMHHSSRNCGLRRELEQPRGAGATGPIHDAWTRSPRSRSDMTARTPAESLHRSAMRPWPESHQRFVGAVSWQSVICRESVCRLPPPAGHRLRSASAMVARKSPPRRLASRHAPGAQICQGLCAFRNHAASNAVKPNPSFKPSPNGGSRWPSSAGPAAHFALAVQHAPPSVPA